MAMTAGNGEECYEEEVQPYQKMDCKPMRYIMCDINSGITSSSMVSFADDTRLYYGISNVDDFAK